MGSFRYWRGTRTRGQYVKIQKDIPIWNVYWKEHMCFESKPNFVVICLLMIFFLFCGNKLRIKGVIIIIWLIGVHSQLQLKQLQRILQILRIIIMFIHLKFLFTITLFIFMLNQYVIVFALLKRPELLNILFITFYLIYCSIQHYQMIHPVVFLPSVHFYLLWLSRCMVAPWNSPLKEKILLICKVVCVE